MFGSFAFMKATALVLYVLLLLWLVYTARFKGLAIALLAGTIISFFLTYLKYDGTNSVQHNTRTETERSAMYQETVEQQAPVKTHTLTFAERMALEDIRSQKENQQIKNELKESK